MSKWICGSFLLILVVGLSTAEPVENNYELRDNDRVAIQGDAGKLDYETALRPAVLQKRSIANIARLLLGGNVPPNHPLVKYPEPKSWNLANNIMAALPAASSLVAAASNGGAWPPPQQASAIENIQQLFDTKTKLLPYTGQVATGLTGLASVKGDLLRQIHSISTQAIAQAAAEAAARALASSAAAHAVTNSVAHIYQGAQVGIKGGWSSYQNAYANAPGKTPGEQPGPPYPSASINHYQAAPQYNNNLFSVPATTPAPDVVPTIPSSIAYQQPNQYQNNNGYYTLYNTQPGISAHPQTPYTPAPPVAHARPTLSPATLIATTPSGYGPSLSKPIVPSPTGLPVIVLASRSNNNSPLNSFRRTVPAGFFGRSFAQPGSTPSLLSTISSLLAASTAAYNAAFTGSSPAEQQPSALLSTLLSSANTPFQAPSSILKPTSPIAAPSVLSSISAAPGGFNGLQRQSAHPLSQGGSNYGGGAGGIGANFLHNHASVPGGAYNAQTGPPAFHPPGYPLNSDASVYARPNYAQLGANPYATQSVQASQFGGYGTPAAAAPPATAGTGGTPANGGISGYPAGLSGSGYPGYNGGPGSSNGHVSGWNSLHAGAPAGAPSWTSRADIYTPGYASEASGNANYSPGSYRGGASPTQFSAASGSSANQQDYFASPPNAYQSPATDPFTQTYSSSTNGQRAHGSGGVRNSNLKTPYHNDQRQSASTMGNDFDDEHRYQQSTTRRNRPGNSYSSSTRSRYSPSSTKKRPLTSPTSAKRPNSFGRDKNSAGNAKRVIPTGNSKGSQFDSSVVVVDDHDDAYYEGDRFYDSDEDSRTRLTDHHDGHRWRFKNPIGQRPNSLHDHDPHGRWHGKENHTEQTPPKNVRGERPTRLRPQPGRRPARPSKNHRDKKVPPPKPERGRVQTKAKRPSHETKDSSKTEAANSHGGRIRQHQYESRDVYTTLPEYVFRLDERPDAFLRPYRKHGDHLHGRGSYTPRLGETTRSRSSKKTGKTGERETSEEVQQSLRLKSVYSKEREETLEEFEDSSRSLLGSAPGAGEEEVFVSVSKASDETSRADILTDGHSNDPGLITSEEFDPEEREAFVDEVYSDHHHRRHDYDMSAVEEEEEVEK